MKALIALEDGTVFGGKTFVRPKLDWREFFNNEELDKAYQIVEVE